jgi:hypothetical protein
MLDADPRFAPDGVVVNGVSQFQAIILGCRFMNEKHPENGILFDTV